MTTIRATMAQALVRWLCAQRTVVDGADAPLFGDASCLSTVDPADAWQCTNSSRLPYLWITTPFLARMDLMDPPTGDVYQAAGATPAVFADAVAASLLAIASRDAVLSDDTERMRRASSP